MPRLWSQILYVIVYCKHVLVYLFKECVILFVLTLFIFFSVQSVELHVLIIITYSYLKFVLFCINYEHTIKL